MESTIVDTFLARLNKSITEDSFVFFKVDRRYSREQETACRDLLRNCEETNKYLVIFHEETLAPTHNHCVALGHFAINQNGQITKQYDLWSTSELSVLKSSFLKFLNHSKPEIN